MLKTLLGITAVLTCLVSGNAMPSTASKPDFIPLKAASAARAPGTVKFTMNVNVPEGLKYSRFYIYSESDPYYRASDMEMKNTVTYDVIPGIYYIILHAWDGANGKVYFYIKENLDCTQDASFTFDFGDCTNHIKVISRLPDGEIACSNAYNEKRTDIIEEGNIDDFSNSGLFIFKRGARLSIENGMFSTSRVQTSDGTLHEFGRDFYFNKLPDGYDLQFNRRLIMKSSQEFVFISQNISSSSVGEETVLENDIADYVTVDANYGEVPDSPDKLDQPCYRFLMSATIDGDRIADGVGYGMSSMDASPRWHACVTKSPGCTSDFIVRYGKHMSDNGFDGQSREFYPIISPRVSFSKGKITLIPALDNAGFNDYNLASPEGGNEWPYEISINTHPRFSWDYNQEKVPAFGNSTPVLITPTVWMPGMYNFSQMYHLYLGRYGEYRACDHELGWVDVTVDEEAVFSGDLNSFVVFTTKEFPLPNPRGKYTFVIENDNVLVDGMPGLNRTVITTDASSNDREAPTVTMLNFRDKNDEINDRFVNPEEGTLEFSAVDYASQISQRGIGWFKCNAPATVKVEYSRDDRDWFYELPVTEVPELNVTPTWGNFYRVALAGVDQNSPSGWFKVRVTLTDAAGNTHRQTISPAFYVDKLAGIDNTVIDSPITRDGADIVSDMPMALYDLGGRLTRVSDTGRLSTEGLTGAYILKTGNSSTKIII